MFPYICAVRYYDELEDNHPVITNHVLVMGKNISDALAHVADYFGEDNIAEITITPIGDGCDNVLDLSEEMYKEFHGETV